MRHFSAPDLAEYLKANTPLLLDVREPWEYETCHIEGSQLVPMRQVPQVLDQIPHDHDIIVICHHGIRSRNVCQFLEQQGYTQVTNLTGGVAAWAQYVDPTMPTY